MTVHKLCHSTAICGLVLAVISMSAAMAQTPAPTPESTPSPAPQGETGVIAGQRFGAWVLACPSSQQAKAACFLVQNVHEALSRKVVFVWLIQYDDQGRLLGAFRLPSGVFVNRGLIMKTDPKSNGLRVEYTRCDPAECQAVFSITDDLAKQLGATKAVTVAVSLTSGQTVNVELNMDGFAAALAALAGKSHK